MSQSELGYQNTPEDSSPREGKVSNVDASFHRGFAVHSVSPEHNQNDRLIRRMNNLFQALPGAVVMLDGEGLIQQCNPAANELLGEPLEDQYWRDVVSRAFAPRWDDGHDISLVNGRVVNIATQPMIDEPGQILLIKDVTETRQLQNQLNHAKRLSAKGEMAAALAHQIRTPLASAILYLSNLSNTNIDDAAREKFTSRSLSRLNYLEKLIEDMLLFARGGNFEMQKIDVAELLECLTQQIEPLLKESGSGFIVHPGVENSPLMINSEAIISVLQNLVENAIQATQKCNRQPILQLTTRTEGGMVQISLTDNGSGIPENIRETLFEPFVTTRATGTGLGLSVAQAVIRSHGGVISVKDAEPQGTTFEVSLPLRKTKVEETNMELA